MGTNTSDAASPHPTDSALSLFAEGRLENRLMDVIGSHVLECQQCTQFLLKVSINLDETLMSINGCSEISGTSQHDFVVNNAVENLLQDRIGRYRIEGRLGQGGFGAVYLAFDEELNRRVAIKVPRFPGAVSLDPDRISQAEAKVIAKLDHPHIVPIFDIGRDSNNQFYIVSKYIDGVDLSTTIRNRQTSRRVALEILVSIAEALHFAHQQHVIHRDVKPSNILLDTEGRAYLTDFGMALQTDSAEGSAVLGGTAAYMSPEQVRGEGHRVDGRSDQFSLAVTMYELLTRRRPFPGMTTRQLVKQIATLQPLPPSEIDATIPKALDRICLKALEKSASQRYRSCSEFAKELKSFLQESSVVQLPDRAVDQLQVVPKGIRSFNEEDAEFFVGLLPGPCNRHGVPESIRFWKRLFESRDADHRESVCVLYGPSGSGKSSFIKAGVLPLLTSDVCPIYLEASPLGLEHQLLKKIRHIVPESADCTTLSDACRAIRESPKAKAAKVVLIIDQFEQWLAVHSEFSSSEFTAATRQCDGARLQTVLIIRDEFWLAASRFMRAIEVDIHDHRNAGLLDLFNKEHAKRVLSGFGVAYERLPADPRQSTNEHHRFLEQAVTWMSESGQVIPIQLVMFAEMMRYQEWNSNSIQEAGGFANLGVNYLDEKLVGLSAPAILKQHAEEVRTILRALLPTEGKALKQHAVNLIALQDTIDTDDRIIQNIVATLEHEVSLISRVDGPSEARGGEWYQLIHDALVPSIREWLARHERATLQGRSHLLLASITNNWHEHRSSRQLPTLFEYTQIVLITKHQNRSALQHELLEQTQHFYGKRVLMVLALFVGMTLAVVQYEHYRESQRLVRSLGVVRIEQVPEVVREMREHWPWVRTKLRTIYEDTDASSRAHVRASFALLRDDPKCLADVQKLALHGGSPEELEAVLQCFDIAEVDVAETFWNELQNEDHSPQIRLRAAALLAQLTPDDQRWEHVDKEILDWLLEENSLQWKSWIRLFNPIADRLRPHLATEILNTEDYHLCGTLSEIYSHLSEGHDAAFTPFIEMLHAAHESASVDRASQQAAAVLALAIADRWPAVWPHLKQSPDPTMRTELIERLRTRIVPAGPLLDHLLNERERDPSIKSAIAMVLASKADRRFIERGGQALATNLRNMYRDERDPGLRSALKWMATQGDWESRLTLEAPEDATTFPMMTVETGMQSAVDYNFSVSLYEVTIAEFLKFRPDHPVDRRSGPDDQCPVNEVSWYDAAAYCNWLSAQHGIPQSQWCFEPNADGEYAQGMIMRSDVLQRTGFRLPTIAEWEAVARAGTRTAWAIGDSANALDKYAWFLDNSGFRTHRVGQLRPNDFGVFDMHGNAWEWTLDAVPDSAGTDGKGDLISPETVIVYDDDIRRLCGGTYLNDAQTLSFSFANWNPVTNHSAADGFRVVRTVDPTNE